MDMHGKWPVRGARGAMSRDERILAILKERDGYISGADIAKELNITRSAVWKHISRFRERGYEIESHPALGHRLISSPDLLWEGEIRYGLRTKIFGRKLCCYGSVGSTNDVAMRMADEGAEEGTLVVSEVQTRGKGRFSRRWESAAGLGIWASVIVRPDISPVQVPIITLWAAASLSESLGESTGVDIRLKWPNDLMVGWRKICGILTEMSSEMDKVHYIIIGFGINVNHLPEDFPEGVRENATSLRIETGRIHNRVMLLQRVLEGLERDYPMVTGKLWDEIAARWEALSCVIDRDVKIDTGSGEISGRAIGVDGSGALILMSGGTTRRILSGDVTCR